MTVLPNVYTLINYSSGQCRSYTSPFTGRKCHCKFPAITEVDDGWNDHPILLAALDEQKMFCSEIERFSCDTSCRNMINLTSQTIVSLEKWPKLVENKGLYSLLLLQFITVHLSGSNWRPRKGWERKKGRGTGWLDSLEPTSVPKVWVIGATQSGEHE